MAPEQRAPMSEERLAKLAVELEEHDDGDHAAVMNVPLARALVAEVRRLREAAETLRSAFYGETVAPYLRNSLSDARAESARLRELLREYGQHPESCPAGRTTMDVIHGWLPGPCDCGWDAVERELAGEGKE